MASPPGLKAGFGVDHPRMAVAITRCTPARIRQI
jgi:hypothetical protein